MGHTVEFVSRIETQCKHCDYRPGWVSQRSGEKHGRRSLHHATRRILERNIGIDRRNEHHLTGKSALHQFRLLLRNQIAGADIGVAHGADADVIGCYDEKSLGVHLPHVIAIQGAYPLQHLAVTQHPGIAGQLQQLLGQRQKFAIMSEMLYLPGAVLQPHIQRLSDRMIDAHQGICKLGPDLPVHSLQRKPRDQQHNGQKGRNECKHDVGEIAAFENSINDVAVETL